MDNFDSILDTGIHAVHRHNIFGVVIFDFHKITHFPAGICRELYADLHVDLFVPTGGDEVDLPVFVFPMKTP